MKGKAKSCGVRRGTIIRIQYLFWVLPHNCTAQRSSAHTLLQSSSWRVVLIACALYNTTVLLTSIFHPKELSPCNRKPEQKILHPFVFEFPLTA